MLIEKSIALASPVEVMSVDQSFILHEYWISKETPLETFALSETVDAVRVTSRVGVIVCSTVSVICERVILSSGAGNTNSPSTNTGMVEAELAMISRSEKRLVRSVFNVLKDCYTPSIAMKVPVFLFSRKAL